MADERMGTVRPVTGRADEVGLSSRDSSTAAESLASQAAGAVQDAYGKTVDAAAEGAKAVRDAAITSHDFVRKFMEDNPHTTTLIALGIGVLIGYTTRREPSRRGWWDH